MEVQLKDQMVSQDRTGTSADSCRVQIFYLCLLVPILARQLEKNRTRGKRSVESMGSVCSTVQVVEHGAQREGVQTHASVVSAAATQDADGSEDSREAMRITVTNLRESEAITYPLVLMEGYIENLPQYMKQRRRGGDGCVYIQASVKERDEPSSHRGHRSSSNEQGQQNGGICWPVVPATGHFKAYALLPNPGLFAIHLQIADVSLVLNIRYKVPRTKYIVRFHYQKPWDSNQGFDAPPKVDNSDNAAIDRIKFNALVLQTAMAELLHYAGCPRNTFVLELGEDGLPVVHLLRSQHTSVQARHMEDTELLFRLHQDVCTQGWASPSSGGGQLRIKHVVILGGAHIDPRTREIYGHKALVDGNLVVLGSCGLHTWPRGLEELTACCLNNTRILPQLFLRECAGQGSYWAKYATGISVILQLLGRSCGLMYQHGGVMQPGFHQLNRILSVFEPTSLIHVSTFANPIGDGRFSDLDQTALVAIGQGGVHWDDLSVDILTVKCAWIISRRRRRSSSLEPRKSAAAA